jgi:predicted alpha/beta-hydrolase family hydrolase
MNPRRRQGKPLRRRTAHRAELRTIVVFCEGRNSEPDYIKVSSVCRRCPAPPR